MYRCESWSIKEAKHRRIDAFKLWCWRRLLRVSWTARRSNQSILKEISPEYSLEGLMLKLKFQYFGYLVRTDSLEKTLTVGKIEGGRRRGDGWMASPTQWTWVRASSGRWWRTGKPGVLQSTGSQRVRHNWGTEQQHKCLGMHHAILPTSFYQTIFLGIAMFCLTLKYPLDYLLYVWHKKAQFKTYSFLLGERQNLNDSLLSHWLPFNYYVLNYRSLLALRNHDLWKTPLLLWTAVSQNARIHTYSS